jgi:hypothetical protein
MKHAIRHWLGLTELPTLEDLNKLDWSIRSTQSRINELEKELERQALALNKISKIIIAASEARKEKREDQ